jgi:hypothetical protein
MNLAHLLFHNPSLSCREHEAEIMRTQVNLSAGYDFFIQARVISQSCTLMLSSPSLGCILL